MSVKKISTLEYPKQPKTDQHAIERPGQKKRMRTAGWKVSSTPPHLEETEDQPTDEEKSPRPKKSPMVAYEPQIPPGNLIREVDILMAQFQGFGTPLGSSLHGSRSSSPMNHSLHGSGPIKDHTFAGLIRGHFSDSHYSPFSHILLHGRV